MTVARIVTLNGKTPATAEDARIVKKESRESQVLDCWRPLAYAKSVLPLRRPELRLCMLHAAVGVVKPSKEECSATHSS